MNLTFVFIHFSLLFHQNLFTKIAFIVVLGILLLYEWDIVVIFLLILFNIIVETALCLQTLIFKWFNLEYSFISWNFYLYLW